MDHQAFFQCRSCFKSVIRERDPLNQARALPGGACGRLFQQSGSCGFDPATATELLSGNAYVGYFACPCGAQVTMPIHDSMGTTTRRHVKCGQVLNYLSSAPANVVAAFRQDGWTAITQAMTPAVITSEADSQERVRAHLIRSGYAFLGGQGSLGSTDVTNAEFTTWAPDWSIEEPGFSYGNVKLFPRNAGPKIGYQFSGVTWPDFVVWDGNRKLAIELKTPKLFIQGAPGRLFQSTRSLSNAPFTLRCQGKIEKFTVGTNIGVAATWLLQYAADIDKEAVGRKQHLPPDYASVFLIDLSVTNESAQGVIANLQAIALQDEMALCSQGLQIFSQAWWDAYYDGQPWFFVGGKIVDHTGADITPTLPTYDARAQQFKATTVCTTCQSPVPLEHRTPAGLCRACDALKRGICVRCGASGPAVCSRCKWIVSAAQSICLSNHNRVTPQEQTLQLCRECMLAAVPAVCGSCRGLVGSGQRTASGLCRVCDAMQRKVCVRCRTPGATVCDPCGSLLRAAQMMCHHPRSTPQEANLGMCQTCANSALL